MTFPFITPVLARSPFKSAFRNGAVQLSAGAAIGGPSGNIQVPIAKGVLSFWMDFDSTASASGDFAGIVQLNAPGQTGGNSNALLSCVANAKPNATQPAIACFALTADQGSGMNFVLRDYDTGSNLVSCNVPWVSQSGTNFTSEWVNIGTWASTLITPPATVNGRNYPVGFTYFAAPCKDSPFFQWSSSVISGVGINSGGPTKLIDSASQLPAITGQTEFNTYVVSAEAGPSSPNYGISYPIASFPGDAIYQVSFPGTGGNSPTAGWHHYIFAFDTSQLVTDANGAQCIRVQCAVDRAGGSVQGGPLFDTKAGAGPLVSQSFPSWTSQKGLGGSIGAVLKDEWAIAAPKDASVKFAYCYFGFGFDFFDLTNSDNLNQFITPGLFQVNWGLGGQFIRLFPVFIHTGDMPFFGYNNVDSDYWSIAGNVTTTGGPPTQGI